MGLSYFRRPPEIGFEIEVELSVEKEREGNESEEFMLAFCSAPAPTMYYSLSDGELLHS